jgi:hypothetical protein
MSNSYRKPTGIHFFIAAIVVVILAGITVHVAIEDLSSVNFTPFVWFGVGVLMHSVLIVGRGFSFINFGLAAFSALIGLVPFRRETDYDESTHLLLFFAIYIGSYVFLMRERVMHYINERLVLTFTLLYWYVFMSFYYQPTTLSYVWIIATLAPSLFVLIHNFVSWQHGKKTKILVYAWYLFTLVVIGVSYFSTGTLVSLFFSDEPVGVGNVELFFLGMSSMYLLTNILYLLALIPIPYRKRQSFAERLKEVQQHIAAMEAKFDTRQSHISFSLITLVGISAVLLFNWYTKTFTEQLIVSILIVMPFVELILNKTLGTYLRLYWGSDSLK